MFKRIIPLAFIILFLFRCSQIDTAADLIILSNVVTMEETFLRAEALVIQGNKIIFVGDEKSALKYKSDQTLLIQDTIA